jgi:hypothetical protein
MWVKEGRREECMDMKGRERRRKEKRIKWGRERKVEY